MISRQLQAFLLVTIFGISDNFWQAVDIMLDIIDNLFRLPEIVTIFVTY